MALLAPKCRGPDAPLLIVGQGLAGSMLGWACERVGLAFRIVDAGHATAASRVGAGVINPLTGRRLAPTWRIDDWREQALNSYREIEEELGRRFVFPIRIHRRHRDAAERNRFEARRAEGPVKRWIGGWDEHGLWIDGAVRIDTAGLIEALRVRWRRRGWLSEALVPPGGEALPGGRDDVRVVIWCVGAAEAPGFEFVPWERAKGEILDGRLPGLDPGVVLNDGQWVLPVADDRVRVGATYDRVRRAGDAPSAAARAELEAAARRLTGRVLLTERHEAAVRVTTADRRPVVGWHPERPRRGIFAGLGSKGALWAPALAAQWRLVLQERGAFDPEVAVSRFWPG